MKTVFCNAQDSIYALCNELVEEHGTFAKFSAYKRDDGVMCYVGRCKLHFRITPQRHECFAGKNNQIKVYLNNELVGMGDVRQIIEPLFQNAKSKT